LFERRAGKQFSVGMKNFIKMEKLFKCLKRKKFCEEERLYNLEEDFITCYKLGLFFGDTK